MKTLPTVCRAAVLFSALLVAGTSFAQPPPGGFGFPGGPGGPIPIPPRPRPPIFEILPPPYYPHRHRVVHSHSDSIAAQVQRKLKNLGYYAGSVDGEIGAKSRVAIRAYQEENGLEITGQVDKALLASLGL